MINILSGLFGTKPNFKELMEQGAVVIDVRTPDEYRGGHIRNSKNFPLDMLGGKTAEIKKMNKPVITVCRSGARSAAAVGVLKQAGIEAYNGGGWTSLERVLQ